MKISTKIITCPNEIIQIQKDLDTFLNSYSENPFILSPFIKYAMQSNIPRNSIPTVLVVKANERIIGLAPLLLRQRLGV
jgi:hypothetical protein